MEHPDFLAEKYADLPGSKPVERAVKKTLREGQPGAQSRGERVGRYLDRLETIIKDKRGFGHLKYQILDKYTTKQDEIPESYWKLQEKIIREKGQLGDWQNATEEQKAELKKQNSEGVLNDQKSSLEQWVDYFASSDSDYVPKFLKYWIFRNVIGLAEYDKEKKEFPKRSKGTVKQFPDINHEALAYVIDAVLKKLEGASVEFEYDIQREERQAFLKFLDKENFAKLYAWANELMNPVPEHLLPVTDGEWRKYERNTDPNSLVKSIRGKGTGWCTAGENTAKTQIRAGDFYCFYSLDDESKPTVPRIAIRMEESKIAEVRGVAYKQNLDPYMGEVLEKKLDEFPDKAEYLKKDKDMRRLTEIDDKIKIGGALGKDELLFLYEINAPIEGFGYQKDPRIAELRKQRNVEEDMLVVFECVKEQIAHSPKEINKNTKAYVGKLEPGIFTKLSEDVEHVYTSFPEGRIRRMDLGIGGKTSAQLEKELREKNINISDYSQDMLRSPEFQVTKSPEQATLVRLKVADLFSDNNVHTTQEIYNRAENLGLELCPAETGPHYRLQYQNQPMNEWFVIGMKPIADRCGDPHVFLLARNAVGLWLDHDWAVSTSEWYPRVGFVFRLRKSKT